MAARTVRKPWRRAVARRVRAAAPLALAAHGRGRGAARGRAAPRAARGRSRQWARRALPLTVSEQGAIGGAGLPAVLLSASGERGPAPGEPVSQRTARRVRSRRAACAERDRPPARSARRREPGSSPGRSGIVTMRNVLPDWAVRLLVGALLLPALLAALDAFFRARRRRLPVDRAGRCGSPRPRLPLVARAGCGCRLLGLTGALHAPPAPVPPRRRPARRRRTSLALVSARRGRRPGLARAAPARSAPARGARGRAAAGGLGGGLRARAQRRRRCSSGSSTRIAAALLLPAAHLWLFAAAPRARPARSGPRSRRSPPGSLAPLLAVAYYALALRGRAARAAVAADARRRPAATSP